MFAAPIYQPYTKNIGLPVFADGLSFAGIVNIQNVEKEWPATAQIQEESLNAQEMLWKSSGPPFYADYIEI